MVCLFLDPEIYPIENFFFRLKQVYRLSIPYRFFEPPIGKPRQPCPGIFIEEKCV